VVAVRRVAVGYEAPDDRFQVVAHVWIGVFRDQEGTARVLDEHVREAAADARAGDGVGDGRGDIAAAASERVEFEGDLVRHDRLLAISTMLHERVQGAAENASCDGKRTVIDQFVTK
jgi:hypothetical protein